MKATRLLYDLGQSLWLDNIARDLLASGTLKKYIESLSVTGLTSNPTIFDHAISRGNAYDAEIRRLVGRGLSGETLFFELAIQDLTQAADLFAPIHERTNGVDGWVSLEVSPLLAYDSKKSSDQAKALHAKANRRNLFIKIPGTPEGLPAIEETIAWGVPVNVTLLFSREQYEAAAEAYLRGLKRRLSAELSLDVHSVASLFVTVGIKQPWIRCLVICATSSVSRLRSKPIKATGIFWKLIAGSDWRRMGRVHRVSSLQAPAPRILRTPMCSTSARSQLPTPSTPCPKKHFSPLMRMAGSIGPCHVTAATATRRSRHMAVQALMS